MAKLLECFQCLSKASTELMTRDQWKRTESPRKNHGVSEQYTTNKVLIKSTLINVYILLLTIYFFILSAFDCDLKDLPILEGILKQIRADNPKFFRHAINN